MIAELLSPIRGAHEPVRNNSISMVIRTRRMVALPLVALIALVISPMALQSTAHAERGWTLGAAISQTYSNKSWSAPSKKRHAKSNLKRSKKRTSKKTRRNRSGKKHVRIYRKYKKNSVRRRNKKRVKVASLNNRHVGPYTNHKSLTGGGVRWAASSSCLKASLRSIIYQVASRFGRVTVNSTCRSKRHNARVGGARRSQHLTGSAVDFRVHGKYGAAYAYLRSLPGVGGYKHYGGGLFHIDTGPRRTW